MKYMQLAYASSAATTVDDAELAEILRISRKYNPKVGITGVLLFHNRSFLQILEGPKEMVEALFELINEDERHDAVVLLMKRMVDARDFGKWSMGFVDTARGKQGLDGFFNVMSDFNDFESLKDDQGVVLQLIDGFTQAQWQQAIT